MSVTPTPFKSVLIANRGEIACRIIRTAKAMGLRTIAVYSEADAGAPHVTMADDVFCLGPAPVSESYLDIGRVMLAIDETRAEAVHPGYGFLSENADFAQACDDVGVVFIGPPTPAIDVMGDKAKSKRRMIEAGVPCVPGYQGEDQHDETLIAAANEIGLPIMVKAAAGGGGRGMRLVDDKFDLPNAIKSARSEAENAFGSGELILERAISEPRHVEIQIFADKHGNVIHLGERDCSVQRRHQKVLEEAPCPVMTPELREQMGAAAVKAARDIDYVGAGTVEFLLDWSGEFYFLEMNTRLQVEHPVTEMITGLDLVAMQIRVARGDTLDIAQEDVTMTGHAIEARLYAEDTGADFLPATGPIDYWEPAVSDGIRIDSGIATGGEVSPYYDPMLSKVIAHGATREEARLRLVEALKTTTLFGVVTNKSFLIDALQHDVFVTGDATTAFIADNFPPEALMHESLSNEAAAVASVLLFNRSRQQSMEAAIGVPENLINWSSATKITTPYRFADADRDLRAEITPTAVDKYEVIVDEQTLAIKAIELTAHQAKLEIDGVRRIVYFSYPVSDESNARLQFSIEGQDVDTVNLNAVRSFSEEAAGAGSVTAPMHGMLLEVFVEKGQSVLRGDRLAVVEAMKMQHDVVADVDGIIDTVYYAAGVQVANNAVILEIAVVD